MKAKFGSTPGTEATTSCVWAVPVSLRPSTLPSPFPITSAAIGSVPEPGKVVARWKVAVYSAPSTARITVPLMSRRSPEALSIVAPSTLYMPGIGTSSPDSSAARSRFSSPPHAKNAATSAARRAIDPCRRSIPSPPGELRSESTPRRRRRGIGDFASAARRGRAVELGVEDADRRAQHPARALPDRRSAEHALEGAQRLDDLELRTGHPQ